MKVLIVNNNHYISGGDSTYSLQLGRLLRAKNIDVFFFSMQHPKNVFDPNSKLFVSQIDFKYLNKNINLKNGIKVVKRSILSAEAKKNFSNLLNKIHPDIVHLQNIHSHITPSILFEAKRSNIPVVWTLHDYKLVCPNSHFYSDSNCKICESCKNFYYANAFFKICKKNSLGASLIASIEAYMHRFLRIRDIPKYFLCPSIFLKEKMITHGFQSEKLLYLPLFIPKDYFQENNKDDGYFLYFGKINQIKGIRTLLTAFQSLPKIKLLIAGKIEETFEKVFFNNLPRNAKYLGFRSGNDLRSLLRNARATILPSLWYENQPFAITEAFASNKPVIASNLGGMAELVKHKKRGILVPPGDSVALASAIDWLHKNPAEAIRLGNNAKSYALKEHNAKVHYNRLIQIYHNVLR